MVPQLTECSVTPVEYHDVSDATMTALPIYDPACYRCSEARFADRLCETLDYEYCNGRQKQRQPLELHCKIAKERKNDKGCGDALGQTQVRAVQKPNAKHWTDITTLEERKSGEELLAVLHIIVTVIPSKTDFI
ncbi:hypothetical protein OSTOST_18370, partial [Ostertagia ostertagi]